jgi:pimeloyl-ACP methyl ester carboxylesterase
MCLCGGTDIAPKPKPDYDTVSLSFEKLYMPNVGLPESTIYYTQFNADESAKPPLVLIHGAGASRLDWPPKLRRLPGIRVIALDLPGHGRSTGSSRADIGVYAEDVCAFLDTLGIERAIIAGHSMGGGIAQQIAITYPDRVAGLILLGTGSKLPVEPALPRRIIEETDAAIDWLIDTAWGENAPDNMKRRGHQRLESIPPQVVRDDYVACQRFDSRPYLEQITAPTLVIAARDDRMMPLKFSQTLAERIPNTTFFIVEDAGHMFPLEKGPEITELISEWLSEKL